MAHCGSLHDNRRVYIGREVAVSVTAADDEDKANTGQEEPKLLEKRELLEERELLEDAGYTISPLRRLQLEIAAGTWIILCLVLLAVVLSIVRWLVAR
jgi:hypothetical protein